MHWSSFEGPNGECMRGNGTWDTGADVGAIDKRWYLERAKRMGALGVPKKTLKMVDGTLVKTYGQWIGELDVEGVRIRGVFEVFESGGGWDVLIGRPIMAAISAFHDTKRDVITVSAGERTATLEN
ncbi:hypothetical protein K438DRAFT_1559956, partial [Mycena galopus ATCC 62051]